MPVGRLMYVGQSTNVAQSTTEPGPDYGSVKDGWQWLMCMTARYDHFF